MRLRTTFLWSMIVSLAAAALLGIAAVLVEEFGDIGDKSLVTSLLVGAFSITALACAFVLDRGRLRPAMWVGVIASMAALGIWITTIWFDAWWWNTPWDEIIIKSGVTTTVLAAWAMHLGLLALPTIRAKPWRIVRLTTLALADLLAGSLLLAIWLELEDEWFWKWVAVISILVSCGTVVSPILALIEKIRFRGEPGAVARRIAVGVTCPRCGTQQKLATGRARCTSCGLRIRLEVEEPRCPCGYLIYNLRGDTCPECGRAIAQEDRWLGRDEAE